MSYILDALRRADAERERSETPGLHAQHVTATMPEEPAPVRGAARWRWLGVGAALVLTAVLAWHFGSREAAPAATTGASPVPQALPAAPPAVAVAKAPAPAPAAVVTSLPPMPTEPPPPAPVAAKPALASVPAKAASALPAARPASAPPSAPAAAEPRVVAQTELPEEIRREIPALVVGGAMYSPTPANRMLILNGQVTHEGDQPAPGLVLEQINLKSAVLRYKGQRFRIAY